MQGNRHFNTPSKIPLHSSGLAEVAVGQAMGTMSSETFGQRLAREYARTTIQSYRHSGIGRSVNGAARSARYKSPEKSDKSYGAVNQNRQIRSENKVGGRQEFNNIKVPQRPIFIEPISRGYDPYK